MCVDSKRCSKCGLELPLVAFGKDKRAKDGLRSACKECVNAENRQYRKDNPDKVREKDKKHYEENKEDILEQQKQYRKDNPEKVRESNRKSSRKYRKKNPEKHRERVKQWEKDNPEKRRAIGHKRRARIADAPGHATPEQIKARMDYHGNKCIYCGSSENIEVEHMIPIANGGSGWASNLAPACRPCNRQKGTMPFLEFIAKKAKEAT